MKEENKDVSLSAKEVFARNLQLLIDKNETTVYQVSKDTGIAHSYLYDLCNPQSNKNPSMGMIERIANYFSIGANELLSRENNFDKKQM